MRTLHIVDRGKGRTSAVTDAIQPIQAKLPPMKAILLLTFLAAIVALAPVRQIAAQEPASPSALDTEQDFIFIQEINFWKALQSHDLATFQALLLPDFLDVEKEIRTRDQILANLNACTLVSFKFRNHQLRMITPDAAVLAYTGFSETACGDSHVSGNYNATTTWVRRDGKWLVQIHTEVPIKP